MTIAIEIIKAAVEKEGSHRLAGEALGISKNQVTKALIRDRERRAKIASAPEKSEAPIEILTIPEAKKTEDKKNLFNPSIRATNRSPVERVYMDGFQGAYDYFNRKLFEGKLPPVLITLQRKGKSFGYFAPNKFQDRIHEGGKVHELAMNPAFFEKRTELEILSTLVHEMCHVEQEEFGTPTRTAHNKEWVGMMEKVGLIPSNTGEPGGKQTGAKVSHYIDESGAFKGYAMELILDGWTAAFNSEERPRAAVKRASKTKYTCPSCDMNVWAKPGMRIGCIACNGIELEPQE